MNVISMKSAESLLSASVGFFRIAQTVQELWQFKEMLEKPVAGHGLQLFKKKNLQH